MSIFANVFSLFQHDVINFQREILKEGKYTMKEEKKKQKREILGILLTIVQYNNISIIQALNFSSRH